MKLIYVLYIPAELRQMYLYVFLCIHDCLRSVVLSEPDNLYLNSK